jgi:DNA-binding MarR family transcriptional regulator
MEIKQPVIPAVGEGKRGEQGHIGYLLRQAQAAHRLRMERAFADDDITSPQFVVLTMLSAYPGASGADIARLSLVTPQTVSVIVNNLERRGAIVRRAHEVHGRIQHIEVTKLGRQLLRKCSAQMSVIEKDLLSGLSSDEEQLIRRWLTRVSTHADAKLK